jgi:hypothetical protein
MLFGKIFSICPFIIGPCKMLQMVMTEIWRSESRIGGICVSRDKPLQLPWEFPVQKQSSFNSMALRIWYEALRLETLDPGFDLVLKFIWRTSSPTSRNTVNAKLIQLNNYALPVFESGFWYEWYNIQYPEKVFWCIFWDQELLLPELVEVLVVNY